VPFPDRVETPRLVLRRFANDELDTFLAVWSDPSVRATLDPAGAFDPTHVPVRFRHHLDHWREHGFGLWAVEERTGGEVVGWVGPTHPTFVPELADEVEVGWTLMRRYRGRGLATEAAAAAVEAAFAHLGPERLISLITPDNHRSIAVATRLGMREDGRVRHGEHGFELCVYALSAGEAAAPADVRGSA
jgi:RimJ/RimL family protein N-acetyltransferase